MNNIIKSFKYGISGLILIASLFSQNAHAERPSLNGMSPDQYIMQLGSPAFTQGGGMFLPEELLNSLRGGDTSMIMQYVLINNLMNKCAADVKRYTPKQSDPFTVAQSKFKYAQCRLQSCQAQGMLVLALPLLSDVASAGGSAEEASGNRAYAQALAQGLSGQQSCGGSGSAVDPALVNYLTN